MQKKFELNQARIEKVRIPNQIDGEFEDLCTKFEPKRNKIRIITEKVRFESVKNSNHNNGFESVKHTRSSVTLTVQNRGWHNTKK